jgi:hypothetical protein
MSDGAPTRRQRNAIDVSNDRALRGECPACGTPSTEIAETRTAVVRVHGGNGDGETLYQCKGHGCGIRWSLRGPRAEAARAGAPMKQPSGLGDEPRQFGFLLPKDDHAMLFKLAQEENMTAALLLRAWIDEKARAKGFRK